MVQKKKILLLIIDKCRKCKAASQDNVQAKLEESTITVRNGPECPSVIHGAAAATKGCAYFVNVHEFDLTSKYTAPTTGCEVLTPNDAIKVLEELLPAQNQSFELGLRLNLEPHQVEGIHSTYSEPAKRLLRVVMLFLNQVEPRPTWRVIVEALKSPAVNLPQLAMAVEAAHFPDATPALVPEASGRSVCDFYPQFSLCLSLFQSLPLRVQIPPLNQASPHLSMVMTHIQD